jgi:mono/diheme cytochrome c family protein
MLTAKLLIAAVLLAAAAASAGSMLSLMGRVPPPVDGSGRRRLHRIGGRIFAAAALANTVLGVILLSRAGDGLPTRLVLHWHLALVLDFLLLIKIAVVRRFRQFLRWGPALGTTLFTLTTVIVLASAGFAVLESKRPAVPQAAPEGPLSAESGRRVFEARCSACHALDAVTDLGGPPLRGLFKKAELPSGRPASEANVRIQLSRPLKAMPSFADLAEADIEALIAFLRIL